MASENLRKVGKAFPFQPPHNAIMTEDADKNGGPNHLKAWLRFRKKSAADLARYLDVTEGMVSELVNSKRQLSAKWLRRIAPFFKTTPGMLLDHDPFTLDSDIIEIWVEADEGQRRQLADLAKIIVRTGTIG